MQFAARPCLNAGVALIGASAIAISPVAPPMPDITVPAVSSAQVNLAAAIDPLQAYISLFTDVFETGSTIIGAELADPAPILQKVLANGVVNATNYAHALQEAATKLAIALDPATPYGIPAALQKALEELLAGNVNVAVATAWSGVLQNGLSLLPLLTVLQSAAAGSVQNLANVLKDPTLVPIAVFGLVGPVYGLLNGVGNAGQNMVDAVKAGDPLGLANAVIAGPAVIGQSFTDSLLPSAQILRLVRQQIADLITPATPLPSALAAARRAPITVTLDVRPQAPAETGSAAKDSTAAGTSSDVTAPVVTDSLKAEPGKTRTLSSRRASAVKQVREGIQGTVKNVTDGFKKAAEGLRGKSTKPGKHTTTKSDSGSSVSGASSSNAA
jgi:hypothetical protein